MFKFTNTQFNKVLSELSDTEKNTAQVAFTIAKEYEMLSRHFGLPGSHKEEWEFISSPKGYIDKLLVISKLYCEKNNKEFKDLHFADLGCGVSPIIITLYMLGNVNLYGIDMTEAYIKHLRRTLYNLPDTVENITNGKFIDRFEIGRLKNFSHTHLCDIIYMYTPIKNTSLYKKEVSEVIKNMKKGALIFDFYTPLNNVLRDNKETYSNAEKRLGVKFRKSSHWSSVIVVEKI